MLVYNNFVLFHCQTFLYQLKDRPLVVVDLYRRSYVGCDAIDHIPEVLQSFKKIHRTRLKVFEGDLRALTAARIKINEEYKKNKHVTDEDSIRAMIKFGEDVETELRTQVIQAREVRPGVFEAKITEDTLKLENVPFNDSAILDDSTDGPRPCCQDQARSK